MMKLLFKIVLLVLLVLQSGCVEREYFDDNGVGPPISGLFKEIQGPQSGILSFKDSPYYVKDDIIVDSSSLLIIEPGVELYFGEGKTLVVKGELKAIGQRYSRIYFLPYTNSWGGVRIVNADTKSEFRFCVFEKVISEDATYSGTIVVHQSESLFRNCYFENNFSISGGGISAVYSDLTVQNVIFNSNYVMNNGGAIFAKYSNISLINNVFVNNEANVAGGAVFIEYPFGSEIQNNIFYKNFLGEDFSHIAYFSIDSTNFINQYNYIATADMDPYFISEDNFRLVYVSPCKNAGNPAPEFNDIDGTRNDQGAYGGPFGSW